MSLNWKWLFIYPDQTIATINTLTVPAGRPLHFELTSAAVMNAFFIPQFGSMIYTMNGMTTRLNIQGDTLGTFEGLSSHFSGDGFSGMHFDVHVVPSERVQARNGRRTHRSTDQSLDEATTRHRQALDNNPPAIFRLADPGLFQSDRHPENTAVARITGGRHRRFATGGGRRCSVN